MTRKNQSSNKTGTPPKVRRARRTRKPRAAQQMFELGARARLKEDKV